MVILRKRNGRKVEVRPVLKAKVAIMDRVAVLDCEKAPAVPAWYGGLIGETVEVQPLPGGNPLRREDRNPVRGMIRAIWRGEQGELLATLLTWGGNEIHRPLSALELRAE